jgi:hypothetical protein
MRLCEPSPERERIVQEAITKVETPHAFLRTLDQQRRETK